jgi:3-hydroxyanthranilate 3,4-dioxygenase
MSSLVVPLNFKKWIDDHRDRLKPPVCNQVVWKEGGFIIMVVGGPNIRKDYHYNQTPEFFYQLEGDMVLKVIDNGTFKDVPIKEGEIYLLPPEMRHSPQRFENTVGLVVEQKRPEGMVDAFEWYCEECGNQLYREEFILKDIVAQLPVIFDHFYSSEEYRTCKSCNTVMEK